NSLCEVFGGHSWAVGIDQAHRFKTAFEQILERQIETLTEFIASLRQQAEIGRKNIGVGRLSADGCVNGHRSTLWRRFLSAGEQLRVDSVRPSETAATDTRNCRCRVAQKTLV